MMKCCDNCYKSMFEDCWSLTRGPDLPATTLAATCYRNMFFNCGNLTEAPELMAEYITSNCYQRMFFNCTSLALIKMNSQEYKAGAFYSDNGSVWTQNVASTGVIWLNPLILDSAGNAPQYVCPPNWEIKRIGIDDQPSGD